MQGDDWENSRKIENFTIFRPQTAPTLTIVCDNIDIKIDTKSFPSLPRIFPMTITQHTRYNREIFCIIFLRRHTMPSQKSRQLHRSSIRSRCVVNKRERGGGEAKVKREILSHNAACPRHRRPNRAAERGGIRYKFMWSSKYLINDQSSSLMRI